MPGTRYGGLRAAETNLKRHGRDFYKRIGKLGGSRSTGGGFAGEEGRQRAVYWGKINGPKPKPRKTDRPVLNERIVGGSK